MVATMVDRRTMIAGLLTAFPAVAFVREARAVAYPSVPLRRWIEGQRSIAADLREGRLSGREWAAEVRRLAREVDVAEVHAALKRADVGSVRHGASNDPEMRNVWFMGADGKRMRLGYATKLFEFSPTNVVTPHGHRHMASAHMVIEGSFRVRNFDRLREEPDALIIRPTRDEVIGLGAASTMSDEKDNVHWFVPRGGKPATTFDVIISGLDEDEDPYRIIAIDPVNAKPLSGGRLRAPKMGFEAASQRYTVDV
ncbi:hypothetical protein [Sphingomicrobium clamense]|uniref:Cupin domain-containing protein n=1 Tax=Sphingomicrobium clamense TaxID=2851013 RepID=A0ABS6V4S0_9SPHN|nr:hypothetical protein [Sphingomicrobium sp. B8]MBW0144554.1 hypothetical protein [Sphingomicrobium sp. B8]